MRSSRKCVESSACGERCLMFVQKPYNLSNQPDTGAHKKRHPNWWWISRRTEINERNTCKQLNVISRRLIIIKALFCRTCVCMCGAPIWGTKAVLLKFSGKVDKLIYIKLNCLLIDSPDEERPADDDVTCARDVLDDDRGRNACFIWQQISARTWLRQIFFHHPLLVSSLIIFGNDHYSIFNF